jgi:cytochrome oxidase Cu insertion factor (SCO1/SenC/PrrC family)
MRMAGPVVSVCTAVLCLWGGATSAQDLYRSGGRWLDDQAHAYTLDSLRGSFTVVTLAYGACRRVCSTSLRLMQQVQSLADERGLALNFVVIGLDPEQDKPADWADLRRDRALTRSNWRFLSGDADAVRRVAHHLGVRYWRYGEHTMHDFRIALLSPDGRVLRSVDAFDANLLTLLP